MPADYNMPYLIYVNRKTNRVIIFEKDDNGEYNTVQKVFLCSVGIVGRETPRGSYILGERYLWRPLIQKSFGQYAVRITGPILFHSVPYSKQDASFLKSEEFNKLGYDASAGCIRLTVRDAKWIYDNCGAGTRVVIYIDPDYAPAITDSIERMDLTDIRKGWDPTDPDPNNPWLI